MDANAEAVYETIKKRRDVRAEFTGEAVPPRTLNRLLAAAHAAPSVGLSQPWDFVLVEATETKRRFKAHVEAQRLAFSESLPPERAAQFESMKIEGIMESSVGVVVTYDHTRGAPHVLGRHAIADAGLYSTCLAIQNLWLAATAEGYGVGWVSFYEEEFLQRLVGLPGHIRPVAWLCLGPVSRLQRVPDLERHNWRRRRPLESAIHREHW